jgi:hypothetical protein
MRIVPTLLAAGLMLSASSAFGAAKSKDAKQPEVQSAVAPASQSADPERKYCIEQESYTGSRLYNRQCLTKAEWAKHGVDVDDQSKSD